MIIKLSLTDTMLFYILQDGDVFFIGVVSLCVVGIQSVQPSR